ncbi:hypothetical protein [Staphylococcus xylosus]|uniref:hypothetical protein n=1 Tax=Staphylococcus xylosus TaxID=1288 RepID=UPI001CDC2A9B|nr:hypothetical protein [Staphylococcus xylosus]
MFERLEVNNVKSFNWKLLITIVIAGFIGELCVFLIIYMGKFDFLKQYEKIDVTVGIIGLVTTFLGAYLGAKIAGNESRKLFKQELKMNDLSKNMDVNLEVLEDIEDVKLKLDNINNLNKTYFLDPNLTKRVKENSNKINEILNRVKKEGLSSASVILYSDIQKLCEKFSDFNTKIHNIITTDDTKGFFENIKIQGSSIFVVSLWENYFINNERKIFIDTLDNVGNDMLEAISVDLIIEGNKSFFEEKRNAVEKLVEDIYVIFNDMEYKNRNELIKAYTKLYKD